MITEFPLWLLGLALLALLIYLARDGKNLNIQRAIVACLTVFVMQAVGVQLSHRNDKSPVATVMSCEMANLVLRSEFVLQVVQSHFPQVAETLKVVLDKLIPEHATAKGKAGTSEAEELLRKAKEKNPDSQYLQERLVILLANTSLENHKVEVGNLIKNLRGSEDKAVIDFANVVDRLYFGPALSQAEVPAMAKTVEDLIPASWYRDVTLLNLYKRSGDKDSYKNYFASMEDKGAGWMSNVIVAIIIGGTVSIIGCIICFVQLCLIARRPSQPKLTPIPGMGNVRAIYVVLIAWMTTQVIVSAATARLGKHLSAAEPLTAAILVAVTYLAENGPGWFYIYWFAFRDKGINLLSGLRLSFSKGSLFGQVFWGIGAWMAAVPIVVFVMIVTTLIFGPQQGSQNPIICILIQMVRSSNIQALILFYMTLAVFAPLCEEPLFRGFVYQSIRARLGVALAVVISAALFAGLHLDPGGFVCLFALGLVFAYVFEKTGRLLPSMIAHGLWNGMNLTFSLMIFGW